MKKRKLHIFILLLIFMFTLHTLSFADVGSFDRYDSGDSSWSSSSSSWDSDWDSDWSSSSSSSDGDLFFLIGWLFGNNVGRGFLIIVILYIIIRVIKNKICSQF